MMRELASAIASYVPTQALVELHKFPRVVGPLKIPVSPRTLVLRYLRRRISQQSRNGVMRLGFAAVRVPVAARGQIGEGREHSRFGLVQG